MVAVSTSYEVGKWSKMNMAQIWLIHALRPSLNGSNFVRKHLSPLNFADLTDLWWDSKHAKFQTAAVFPSEMRAHQSWLKLVKTHLWKFLSVRVYHFQGAKKIFSRISRRDRYHSTPRQILNNFDFYTPPPPRKISKCEKNPNFFLWTPNECENWQSESTQLVITHENSIGASLDFIAQLLHGENPRWRFKIQIWRHFEEVMDIRRSQDHLQWTRRHGFPTGKVSPARYELSFRS